MYIRSDRLLVWFDPPHYGWADNNRFDRTGAATSIVLDGKYTFATPESHTNKKTTTGGMGLMAEFLGQDFIEAAAVGERFHKAGVGTIERVEEDMGPYAYMKLSCERYEADIEQDGDNAVVFSLTAPMMHGHAFDLTRRASVQGNVLTMQATMTNKGEKAFSLLEYNHNFANLNDRVVGQDYRVDLTYPLTLGKPPAGVISQDGTVYTFSGTPERPFFLSTDDVGDADTYGWTLSHAADGLRMSEKVSEKPARTAMWGTEHIVSVEVFLPISLKPGESKTWTREWTFDA